VKAKIPVAIDWVSNPTQTLGQLAKAKIPVAVDFDATDTALRAGMLDTSKWYKRTRKITVSLSDLDWNLRNGGSVQRSHDFSSSSPNHRRKTGLANRFG
jgi:hypothetical protein